jgi:hypothetical protein
MSASLTPLNSGTNPRFILKQSRRFACCAASHPSCRARCASADIGNVWDATYGMLLTTA